MTEKARRRGTASAVAVAGGIMLSRIAGLVRQRIFAHYLGSSDAAGAFVAALRIPNLLQNLFGAGALSASFVPVYARLLAEGREEEAAKAAGATLSLLTLVIAVLVALGMTFSRPLITVVAPGFTGDVRELTITLVTIMFPGTGLLVLAAWCLGVLNSHRRFFLSYVAPVLWNIAMIAALAGFGGRLMSSRGGQMHLAVLTAWATVAGAALQLGVQVPGALRLNGGLHLSLGRSVAPLRAIVRGFFPALLSRGVTQLSAYVDQILASFLGPQAVASLAYAQMLYNTPISLFGISISSVELTEMSSAIGDPQAVTAKIKERLIKGLRRISFFTVPSSVAFVMLGGVLASTLFQTGKFGRSDSMYVWLILGGWSIGLLATVQSRLCVSALWALGDTKTPAAWATVRVALTAGLGYAAVFPVRAALGWSWAMAAAGLTAAAGTAGWIEFLLIRRTLTGRIGEFHVKTSELTRHWLSALVSGGLVLGASRAVPATHPFLIGCALIAAFAALYIGLALAWGVAEARDALDALSRWTAAATGRR